MYALFALSLALAVGKNIFSKIGKKRFGDFSGMLTLNIVAGAFAVALFLCMGLDFRKMDGAAFWTIALAYGIFTMSAQMFHIIAIKYGELSVCSMIYSSGFLVSTVFSVFYFHETVGVLKGIGLFLTCLSIFLISVRFQKRGAATDKKRGYKYLLFAVPAMLSSGLVGVLQKLFADLCGSVGLNEYLFLGFAEILLFSGVIKLGLLLFKRKKRMKTDARVLTQNALELETEFGTELKTEGEKTPEKRAKRAWIVSGVLALGFAACWVLTGRFNLYLTGVIDGVIFFPVYNGGTIALTAAVSFLCLKEKPTVWKLVGIAIGICSFVLIGL